MESNLIPCFLAKLSSVKNITWTHVNPWLFYSNVWQNSLQKKKKQTKPAKKKKKKEYNLSFSCWYVQHRHTQLLCCVQLFATPRIVARQTPLSMEFSRQEYWSGLPFPPPGDLPDPGIEPIEPPRKSIFNRSPPYLGDGSWVFCWLHE